MLLISPLQVIYIFRFAEHPQVLPGLALLLALFLTSCSRQDLSGGGTSSSEPARESWNVQIMISQADSDLDESLPRLRISADHVQWVGESDTTIQHLQGLEKKVEVVIHDSTGAFSALLKADHVIYHKDEEYFIAEGGVLIETDDDRTLATERIGWWERDQLLRTDEFVHITTPEEIVSGMGLEATEDLSTYQIGRFRAEIMIDQ
ncbi:MAG: hypothetical protein F4065_11530 [Rhodothermaceae bacterium]|nr:hypothetical protein [Rhodothermaceae bacterium]